eukprot:m.211036 g.211036  ORF g.211036 m.211036 type:complete len:948 (-) comp33100_c0_seq1:123-2966(-)
MICRGHMGTWAASVDNLFQQSFERLGGAIAKRPWAFILFPILLAIPLVLGYVLSVMRYPMLVQGINRVEYDMDKLYTPKNAQTFDDRAKVENLFGYPPRVNIIYAGVDIDDDQGLLTKKRLLALYEVWHQNTFSTFEYTESEYVEGGSSEPVTLSLQDICVKGKNDNCLQTSILSFWDYNRTLIASLADEELLQTVVDKEYTAVEPDGSTTTWSAITATSDKGVVVATQLHNYLVADWQDLIKTQHDTPTSKQYEKVMSERLNSNKTLEDLGDFDIHFWGLSNQDAVNQEAMVFDSGLVPIGFILLVVYAMVVLSTNNGVHSHGSLSVISFLCCGISIGTTYGLGCWMQIQYSLVIQVTAFLLVGLGMDDTFVLVAAFNEPDVAVLPTPQRIKESMSRAGASITVTTVTDLCAFLIGSITEVPAIQAFCYYSAIGVSVNFFFQITTFCAFMTYSSHREKAGRYDWIFCKASDPDKNICSDKKYDPEADPIMTRVMVWYSRHLLTPVGKTVVLVATAALVACSSVGAYNIEIDFDIEWFTPEDSYFVDIINFRQQHFGEETRSVSLYTFEVPYHTEAVQVELNSLAYNISDSEHLASGSCRNWWPAFKTYASTLPNTTLTSYGVDEPSFNATLTSFLNAPAGKTYKSAIQLGGVDNETVLGTRIVCLHASVANDAMLLRIRAMNDLRVLAAHHQRLGPAIAYNYIYIFYEGLEKVRVDILTNVAFAILAVFVIGVIVLGNLSAACLVFLMLLCIDVEIMGMLYLLGQKFNYVTGINLVLAVGLSVDANAHICHAFLSADGTGDERAAKALKLLGRSVLNGILSTAIIMVPFYFASRSYVFRVFYECITSIMLFSAYHGLVVLPVVLSLVKPQSYNEVKKEIQEKSAGKVVASRGLCGGDVEDEPVGAQELRHIDVTHVQQGDDENQEEVVPSTSTNIRTPSGRKVLTI